MSAFTTAVDPLKGDEQFLVENIFIHGAKINRLPGIPKTLEIDRYLWGKKTNLFIRKPRRNPGYAYVFFFNIGHFSRHIQPINPKRSGYISDKDANFIPKTMEKLRWRMVLRDNMLKYKI